MIPSTMIKRMMKKLISTSSEAAGFIIGPFHNILGNRNSPLLFFFGPPSPRKSRETSRQLSSFRSICLPLTRSSFFWWKAFTVTNSRLLNGEKEINKENTVFCGEKHCIFWPPYHNCFPEASPKTSSFGLPGSFYSNSGRRNVFRQVVNPRREEKKGSIGRLPDAIRRAHSHLFNTNPVKSFG